MQPQLPAPGGAARRDVESGPENRGLVITLCLLISVVLWFTLSLSETSETLVTLQTQVTNMPSGTTFVELPPATVRIEVAGVVTDLFSLGFKKPTFEINATDDVVDVNTALQLPPGVSVQNVFPKSIELHKDRILARKIPVQPRVDFTPAATYDFFVDPLITPDSVVISGAQAIVQGLTHWPTAPAVKGRVRDTVEVVVALSDTLSGLVEVSHTEARVASRAYVYTESVRTLPVTVTELPTTQQVVQLDPASVDVTYRIPLAQYQAARKAEDFFATVSYEMIRTDTTGWVSPEIHLPTELLLRHVGTFPRRLEYFIYIGTE